MKGHTAKLIKVGLFTIFLVASLSFILFIFWDQELKYNKPTPVPGNYVPVALNTKLELENLTGNKDSTIPVFIHFFNSNCPCSRFNMQEFETLSKKYSDKIKFYIVVQDAEGKEYIKKYRLTTSVLTDTEGKLADLCGVYSTPQAVILNREHRLYYRGNYNKARFCTKKETQFAEQALAYMLGDKPLPPFSELATTAYGCTLPSDKDKITSND